MRYGIVGAAVLNCAEARITYPSRSDCIKIVFVSDVHIGNGATDEALVKQVAGRLQEPDTYWLDLGDRCDFINTKDKRFDPSSLPDWVEVMDLADLPAAQIRRYSELFGPVAPKCLMALEGNHEWMIRKRYDRDVYRNLNAMMGLYAKSEHPALEIKGTRCPGVSGFLRLRLRRGRSDEEKTSQRDGWTLTIFVHHGTGGGKLAGSKAINLERLPMAFDADVFAMGHTHTKLALSKRRIGIDSRRMQVVDKPMALINTGAFMRNYVQVNDGYGEEKLLYPQGVGPVELWLYPNEREWKLVS